MRELSVREMRKGYEVLHKLLEEEGEIVLTQRGKPYARVLPFETATPVRRIPSLKWLRDQIPFQEIPSEILVREDRDARD